MMTSNNQETGNGSIMNNSNRNEQNTRKGKGRANTNSRTTDSNKTNNRNRKLALDTFINPVAVAVAAVAPLTHQTQPEPSPTRSQPPTAAAPPPPPPKSAHHGPSEEKGDDEDDEVQPIDRGEALVRRRMKERQRIKKEAERRLRRAADEELPSTATATRPANSSAIHSRPTTSRTKTAPSLPPPHHPHNQQSAISTHRDPKFAHRDPRLASPSFESFWSPASALQPDTTSTTHDQDNSQSPEPRSTLLRVDTETNATSSPPARGTSPIKLQSTYQSFGSPSQFSNPAASKSSSLAAAEKPGPPSRQLPLNVPSSNQQASSSAKSSLSLHGKFMQHHPINQTPQFQHDDSISRPAHGPYNDDGGGGGGVEEEEEEEELNDARDSYDLSTPTARGRARIPKTAVSLRSNSTAAHSLHRPSSRFSVAQSKSGDYPHEDSQSLLSTNEHDDLRSHHSSVRIRQNQDPSHDDDDDDDDDGGGDSSEHHDSSSLSSPLDDDVEYTLKDRQDAINIEHPFGLPIWKPALYKKSRSVARNAEAALHNSPTSTPGSTLTFGNVLWSLIFGIWLAVVAALVAAILFVIPWGGSKYGRVVWELAGYLVWPFGKYVEEWSEEEEEDGSSDQQQQSDDHRAHSVHPAERFGSGRFDFSSSATGPHSSRWVTVSEIDEDEVASIDRLTIRGGTENDDERTALVPMDRERPAANYGGTSPSGPTVPTNSQDRRHASDSTIKSDLLGLFMNNKRADGGAGQPKRQIRVRALGRLSFWVAYYLIIAPLMLTACLLCWFFVVTIPMAKLLWVLVQHVGTEPLALHFRSPPTYIDLHQVEIGLVQQEQQEQLQQQMDGQPAGEARPEADPHPHHHYHHHHRVSSRLPPQLKPGQPAPKHSKKSLSESRAKGRLVSGKAKVLLCTYKALGLQYYKYTVDGVNIMFIILIPFVMFVILDFFFLAPLKLGGVLGLLSSQMVLFVMALLSVIPLSYFIGMAVASISAQSSIGMGAVINATFGSVIEIILYGIALAEGKGELVEGSIIGSLLAGVLLLPGTSMIGGSFKRKEQRFNARSAGVTSTMLIMAIIGTLTPTLFYEIYGTFQLTCSGCPDDLSNPILTQDQVWKCKSCRYEHLSPVTDSFYQTSVKGLSYYCAGLLVLSYLIGLWFSLRTHASQIWQTPASVLPHGAGEHGGVGAGVMQPSTGGMMGAMGEHLGGGAHGGMMPGSTTMGITGQEHAEFPHMTNQQRMSMYVRRLPEIVKQQLLPHLQRSVSAAARQTTPHVGPGTSPSTTTTTTTTTSSSSSKQPVGQGENTSGGLSYPGEEAERDDRLPRTLTTEEVNQTLHVLQMASHGFPASSYGSTHHKPSRSPSQMMMTGPADSHTREPSHSHSVQVHHHPHSQHSQHHQHSQQQHGIPPTSHPHPHPHHQHVSVGAAAAAAGVVSGEEAGGHDAPNWSRTKSTTVLLTCTALYAIIAEILVSVVDVVLDGNKNLPEKFLGISLFALVPNTTEFMNAISFAINGNIALSMEIGSAYALQVCLIQIPAMVAISALYNADKHVSAAHTFTLVFPRWDVIAIIFSVFLLTYTYIEARANYHRGTILVLSYLVLIGGFYSAPVDDLGALAVPGSRRVVGSQAPLGSLSASWTKPLVAALGW